MNDINWREMDLDYTWELLMRYPDSQVLVETEITIRVDFARYVEDSYNYGPWLSTAHEKVKRIAFIG